MSTFLTLPLGECDQVTINCDEIASMRGHVVTSYSYVDYTLVTLKNGVEHDCRIKHDDLVRRLTELTGIDQ